MKSIKVFTLALVFVIVSACGNSVERADRTVGLIQENVTSIIGKISEVQNFENDLQTDFEATLALEDDLSSFTAAENPVETNIASRRQLLNEIEENRNNLIDLLDEINEIPADDQLPMEQLERVVEYVENLSTDLDRYVSNYLDNLNTESITFKSIGNPDLDHESFFAVFDNVNQLSIENHINLDLLIAHFEPLNSLLINLKVYLVNITEANS